MSSSQNGRRTYEESLSVLRDLQVLSPEESPPLPERAPHYEDEGPLGFSFFRHEVEDVTFERLTLPRTFIGRSDISNCSFTYSDLSESTICWNDFSDVSFAHSDLSQSDLRSNEFEQIDFSGATLTGCDFRHSGFTDCRFDDAVMVGAILVRDDEDLPVLSEDQIKVIDWRDAPGEEPPGG